jgi:hypothetical protein
MILDEVNPYARVLVCVVQRRIDLERIHTQRWYRIPIKRAPTGLTIDYLAFYPTAACGPERWAIRWIAPVLAIRIVRRIELLPEEIQHPRAEERYYCFRLGEPHELPAAIPAHKLRRISFIPTTHMALLQARDVAELWQAATPELSDVWGAGIGRRAMRS